MNLQDQRLCEQLAREHAANLERRVVQEKASLAIELYESGKVPNRDEAAIMADHLTNEDAPLSAMAARMKAGLPTGSESDQVQARKHQRALKYASEHEGVSYAEARRAIDKLPDDSTDPEDGVYARMARGQ